MSKTIPFGTRVRNDTGTESFYGTTVGVVGQDGRVDVQWEKPHRTSFGGWTVYTSVLAKDLEVLEAQYPATQDVHVLARGLEVIRKVEKEVQLAGGCSEALEPTRLIVSQFSHAMIAETIEVANELQWKLWKTASKPNPKLALEEMADMVAFFGLFLNWLKYYDIEMEQVARAFIDKSMVNVQRLRGEVPGYGLEKIVGS